MVKMTAAKTCLPLKMPTSKCCTFGTDNDIELRIGDFSYLIDMFECTKSVPKVHQKCTKGVPKVYQKCTKGVPKVYQKCTKSVPKVYQKCTKSVPKVYQKCTKSIPKVYQRCTKSVPKVYQKCTKVYQKCTKSTSLWTATSNGTNIQYDQYKNTKQVLTAIRKDHEDRINHE